MSLQTCMNLFILWNIEDISNNVHFFPSIHWKSVRSSVVLDCIDFHYIDKTSLNIQGK